MVDEEPLLQAYWRDLEATGVPEAATAGRDPPRCLNVLQLQQQYPNQFIQYLKHQGIVHLGETSVAATDLPRIFGGAAFITRGSKEPGLQDWYRDWGVRPAPCHPTPAAASAGASAVAAPATAPLAGPTPAAAAGGTDAAVQPAAGAVVAAAGTATGDGGAGVGRWRVLRSVLGGGPASGQSQGPAAGERRPDGGPATAAAAVSPAPLMGRRPPLSPEMLPPAPTVVLEAYRVNVHSAAAPEDLGLLRPLLRRWQMGSSSAAAFGLPAVQAVVAYKWDLFARRLLLQQLGAYVLWLAAFTAFMLLFRSSDAAVADRKLLSSWRGRAAVASEVVALVGMAPFAACEVCALSAYGLLGWTSVWKIIDSSTYGVQIAITVLHLGTFRNGPFWLTLAVAVQAVLLVVRLTYFSRVFRSTTFDLMGSLQSISQEVGWYVAVLLLLMWGFAGAFYTILRADPAAEGFTSLPLSLLTMFNYAVGGTSEYMSDLLASRYPAAAIAFCTLYQFIVSMLLMSLLTGVTTNALMRVDQRVALVLNRAQVIDELETVLPPRLLASYGDDEPYVHVLRVSPKSLERLDDDGKEADIWGLWTAETDQDSGGGGGGSDPGEAAATAATGAAGPDVYGDTRRGSKPGVEPAAGDAGGMVRLEAQQVARLEEQLLQMHRLLRQLVEGGARPQ